MTVSAHTFHKEKALKDHLVAELIRGEGYIPRDPATDYSRQLALDKELVLRFIQSTQPDKWNKLSAFCLPYCFN